MFSPQNASGFIEPVLDQASACSAVAAPQTSGKKLVGAMLSANLPDHSRLAKTPRRSSHRCVADAGLQAHSSARVDAGGLVEHGPARPRDQGEDLAVQRDEAVERRRPRNPACGPPRSGALRRGWASCPSWTRPWPPAWCRDRARSPTGEVPNSSRPLRLPSRMRHHQSWLLFSTGQASSRKRRSPVRRVMAPGGEADDGRLRAVDPGVVAGQEAGEVAGFGDAVEHGVLVVVAQVGVEQARPSGRDRRRR